MKSMTGYAWATRRNERCSLSLEIKGCNNRFLEISVYLPPFLSSLESRVRELVSARLRRGKIDVFLKLREYDAALSVSVNREALRAYGRVIGLIAEEFSLEGKPSLETVLHLEGVLETEKTHDDGQYRALAEEALLEALDSFDAERLREGAATEKEILSHVAALEDFLGSVVLRAPEMEAAYRDHLRGRFQELLGDGFDEGRVLAETAAFMVKASVAEEISRLRAHLAEFRAEAGRNPAPGKKLDFLCQEINREVNTIGSKSPDIAVSRAVVGMKDALENIREQLRNVE